MDSSFLVVGLGNPGREYEQTRHNAGFMVVSRLAERRGAAWSVEKSFAARVARMRENGRQIVLCQPLTYMNLSGDAVGKLMEFYKIPVERLLVVTDDADLPLGALRLRPGGSSGGHHGLESIERRLSSREFSRQRVGIGRQEGSSRQIAGYVLSQFEDPERPKLDRVLARASDQIERWLESGVASAMNDFNGMVPEDDSDGKL
ncbi:MAG: aminoacyl-tRNA hydrolase [Verrucomicrobia bacterium]|nr:aminoacyl-tRNA hydrolase [Verrucomicrobiota bacterium]